ncbi:MAG: lysoplasmalogenase family protein [Candidatus Thorarchaeota archaeon]
MSRLLKSPLGILRLLIVIAVLVTVVLIQLFVGLYSPNWIFLSGSAMIVILALVNFVEKRDNPDWSRFVLLMFLAMLVCFIADLLMAGVFYIIPGESLINGVIFFLTGHVFYLLALRNSSPLLLRSESPKVISRNLFIWFIGLVVLFVLFFLTLYNPADMVISIGLLFYGVFMTSSLFFSITKWFGDHPKFFSLCLIVGFLLFFISDYILGYRILIDGDFLSGIEAVGITYLLGQMTIHLSPLFSE